MNSFFYINNTLLFFRKYVFGLTNFVMISFGFIITFIIKVFSNTCIFAFISVLFDTNFSTQFWATNSILYITIMLLIMIKMHKLFQAFGLLLTTIVLYTYNPLLRLINFFSDDTWLKYYNKWYHFTFDIFEKMDEKY